MSSDNQRREFLKKSLLSLGALSIFSRGDSLNLAGPEAKILENLVNDIVTLNREDFLLRQEKAKEAMSTLGIDALLLTGGVNLKYFTNTSWGRSERLFGAILPKEGDPVWICPAFELERAEERIEFGTDIRTWEEHESPDTVIKNILKDLGILNGTLAVGPTVRSFTLDGLKRELTTSGTQLVDGSSVTESCRVTKTGKEIAYMDLANRIQKLAYKSAFSKLEEGMTPREVAGIVSSACSEMGVSGGGYPQFGQNSAYPHGSSVQRTLTTGSILLIDGGCSVEGFRADVTRTIVFGKPTDKQRRVFDIVLKAQQMVQAAVRPGITCESLDIIARKHIEKSGFGPDYKYFAHRLGHGIGMEGHEYTYLVRGNKTLLKPGMTFSNEPGIYIYGEFGVRVEDCFVVTEEGSQVLGGMESTALDKPFG